MAAHTTAELVACAARELRMREVNYPKWDNKPLANLSPARRKEIDMMRDILNILNERLAAEGNPPGEQLNLTF